MSDDDQWQNVYLNDVLEMDEVSEPEPEAEPLPDPSEINKLQEVAEATKPKQDLSKLNPEEGDEIVDLNQGDFVEVDMPDGKSYAGKVLEIDEDAGTVKVQINKPRKRVVVPVEDVFLIDK